MSQIATIRLINSMSKEEKRKFKLNSRKQAGRKDYIDLFNIIDQTSLLDIELINEKFRNIHPHASIENTSRYLLNIITDSLVDTKIKEDNLFHLSYGLLRVKLLQSRSLEEEGYKELQKLQKIAITSQNKFQQYLLFRQELDYYSNKNFKGFLERDLIEVQMKSRNILRDIRVTQEHSSLYELLKYRLVHTGKILSEEKKKDLNDLILSEMSLVTGRGKYSFESQKLHLLFQSFFFTDIGDYKSALKSFFTLNKLFEQNVTIWDHPPFDYFSSLDGILDSLRTFERHEEMKFYIKKMEQLDNKLYPEFFRNKVQQSVMIYQLSIFIGHNYFGAAIKFIENASQNFLKLQNLILDEKQSELYFYFGLAYFKIKNFKKAQKYINNTVLMQKVNYQSIIYKVSRLLSILIHYEDDNFDYLDYEIRSYKRPSHYKEKLLKTEQVIFKTIQIRPDKNKSMKNELLWKKILPTIKAIEKDKYEMQLKKYFDFTGWIRSQFKKEN